MRNIPVPFECPAVRVELGLSAVGTTVVTTVVTGAGMVGSALMMAQEMPLQAGRDGQVRVVNGSSAMQAGVPCVVAWWTRGVVGMIAEVGAVTGGSLDRSLLPDWQLGRRGSQWRSSRVRWKERSRGPKELDDGGGRGREGGCGG